MIYKSGTLKTITGPMFAGKTSKMLQEILWLNHQGKKILAIKPNIDNRYSDSKIATHDHLSFDCFVMENWKHVLDNHEIKPYNYHTVFIDEIQFMNTEETLKNVMNILSSGVNVVASGLSQDSRGYPFETTAMIMAISDEIVHLKSICSKCGRSASKTQRLSDSNQRVSVGSFGMYEPRCVEHWNPK